MRFVAVVVVVVVVVVAVVIVVVLSARVVVSAVVVVVRDLAVGSRIRFRLNLESGTLKKKKKLTFFWKQDWFISVSRLL